MCAVCSKAVYYSKDPKPHTCYKNWSGTSTAMEADIIVDGFTHSIDMHGLIYDKLIGDGDSSVMKKLLIAKPYGPDQRVKKIECSNHILRNYCNRLRDIATRRKSANGLIIPGYQRTKLKENVLRLR